MLHGEHEAPDGVIADDAPVHRLGQLLRGIGGVPGEGLESGDEDVTRPWPSQGLDARTVTLGACLVARGIDLDPAL